MEVEGGSQSVVDPEVRAYVYSLVTALGGTGSDEDGRYTLGDDALACLKDIKRWLKLYDEKANRLDVARCLAEANLVKGDLLEILAAWPEEATEDRAKSKVALACLEILVPLTWPIEKDETHITINHHRHIPYLQLARVSYKRDILEHESSSILRSAVRTALPSIALPLSERNLRDEGIIRLLLYFLRNIVMISASPNLPVEWNENEVSRAATIEAFHKQEILALLLTISANTGEDFNTHDVVVLEILFHLLKGVNPEKMFMDEAQLTDEKSKNLQGLMNKEADMLRGYTKKAPTRHNRFGTMIWVKRDDERVSSVSGQDILTDSQNTLLKMDQSKKWNRPKGRRKDEQTLDHFDLPTPLTYSASRHLRAFVEDFLDAGFNPLFSHIRRAIEREAERILDSHTHQFFYLISWFLEAERVRREKKNNAAQLQNTEDQASSESDNFSIVASVLNQETFILLNRFMQDRLDLKLWHEVSAGMKCFTQILLTVQEMADSNVQEDQEIAENIQNRIFYEESTHDRIISILRGYKDQGFGYLNSSTELFHVFVRMLERYSKENGDLQIRTRRRARKKKKYVAPSTEKEDLTAQESEAEDVAEAQRISMERKFDFNRLCSKFINQSCIDTFVAFTTFFEDLDKEQLKRAHRYFFRVAFKQHMGVMLFRLDIIALFNRMIKGPNGLSSGHPMFKEWDDFARQLFRQMIKKFQQRPELAVELLFSKINSTVYYLEYGYEKQTVSSKPRIPAELEVKGSLSQNDQIGVAVAVLVLDQKINLIHFIQKTLESAASERLSWEANADARRLLEEENADNVEISANNPPSIFVRPDDIEVKAAMSKNNKLRLLLTVVGIDRFSADDEYNPTWVIPSHLTAAMLKETAQIVEQHLAKPTMMYGGDDDSVPVEEMIRRKSAPRQRERAEFDDDDDGIGSGEEEDFLFEAGGPTNRRSSALVQTKQRHRKRGTDGSDEEGGMDEEALKARRRARAQADLEKRRKIKSAKFVHDSDDDTDEEQDRTFFLAEEARRKAQASKILEVMNAGSVSQEEPGKNRKRKSGATDFQGRKKAKSRSVGNGSIASDHFMDSEDDSTQTLGEEDAPSEDEPEVTDTPRSSLGELRHEQQLRKLSRSSGSSGPPGIDRPLAEASGEAGKGGIGIGIEDKDDEEEALLPSTARRRNQTRLLDDSDDD